MGHLIACLGKETNTWNELNNVISSGWFDKIYLISGMGVYDYVKPQLKPNSTIEIIRINIERPSEELVPDLYVILKKHFLQDKLQELDMAVNITSGTGKEHAIIISTIMKLGYGIRLVDLDKNGQLLEMI